jgi:hypothetical protein
VSWRTSRCTCIRTSRSSCCAITCGSKLCPRPIVGLPMAASVKSPNLRPPQASIWREDLGSSSDPTSPRRTCLYQRRERRSFPIACLPQVPYTSTMSRGRPSSTPDYVAASHHRNVDPLGGHSFVDICWHLQGMTDHGTQSESNHPAVRAYRACRLGTCALRVFSILNGRYRDSDSTACFNTNWPEGRHDLGSRGVG